MNIWIKLIPFFQKINIKASTMWMKAGSLLNLSLLIWKKGWYFYPMWTSGMKLP